MTRRGSLGASTRCTGQQGFTLLETMLTVVLAALIMVPLFGWAYLAARQQAATFTRNIDGASIGFLRTSFLRDVASSSAADAGADANGSDCAGGGTSAAAVPGDTLLRLDRHGNDYVVYNRATSSDGDGVSIWRRDCDGPNAVRATELVRDVSGASLSVTCAPRPTMPSTDCGRISLRVTTTSGQAVSMSASLRAGTSNGSVGGAGAQSPYVSPDVVVSVSDVEVYRGEVVTFDGVATIAGGEELTYRWELGDGTTADTATVDHSYSQLGEFTAVFTATTAAGTPTSDYVRVQVVNRPPMALISSPTDDPLTVNRCQDVSFAAVGSSDPDAGGSIVRYLWDYGDGQSTTRTSAASHTHKFSLPRGSDAPYDVTLSVEDSDHDAFGHGADSASTRVIVNNRPPSSLSISASWGLVTASGGGSMSVTSPATVSFSATASDPDGACDTLSYRWFVDGTVQAGATSSTFAYTAADTAAVTVEVRDDQGSARTSSAITVSTNGPPSAAFTLSSGDVRAGQAVTATSTSNDAETPFASLVHHWSFPNGTATFPNGATHSNPGTIRFGANVAAGQTFDSTQYNVTLYVTDGSGANSPTVTRPIVVRGAPAPTGIAASGSASCSGWACPIGGGTWTRTNTVTWVAVPAVAGVSGSISYDADIRWCTFNLFGCVSWSSWQDAYAGTATSWQSVNHSAANNSNVEIRVRTKDPYTETWSSFATAAVSFK